MCSHIYHPTVLRKCAGDSKWPHAGAALARSLFLAASVSSMLRILYCRDSGTSWMPVSHEEMSCCLIFCPCQPTKYCLRPQDMSLAEHAVYYSHINVTGNVT